MDILTRLAVKLDKKANEIRKSVLELCVNAGTGHVTSSLSCVDLLVALYYGDILHYDSKNPKWPERDRFILSKGQASPALYAVLADAGFFNIKDLNRFAQQNGKFGVHLQYTVPGAEITSGSLGQGIGIAAGMALAAKMNRELHLVVAMLGDGECYEGSIWETAMFTSHYKLNNLIAIVDRNYLCATDFTENIVAMEPMDAKWEAFGWNVVRIDGHSMIQILKALSSIRTRTSDKPLVVIANTEKGKGIKSICNIPLWHAVTPKGKDADKARRELDRYCRSFPDPE